ncbi:hypothetical protein [Roseateles sp. LYH14W]|uniref:Uncharacterized protein n=1 Tax=Pelomonas parva TaxID=3299032 RepID=A0ABW7F9P2_9BURK
MSSDKQYRYKRGLAPFDVQDGSAHRRLDLIEEPARPLGDKSAALMARRRRPATMNIAPASQSVRVVSSADATLTFSMRPAAGGMLVERTHCRSYGPRIVLQMLFDSPARFDRWCASEPVRFDDPMLFDQLCRHGHEVLCIGG